MTCEGCGGKIRRHYPNGGGGDMYASCAICEWHSENEDNHKVRDFLVKAEIIDIKKDLNTICALLYTLAFGRECVPKGLTPEAVLDEVYKTKMKLVERDE